ncbi:MAG: MFS transporter [Chloroflexota bacterium]|nr:MFS transporter [Chloroflexota bacterium]
MVGAGTFLYFLGIGSIFYGFSTFFNPMVEEFGWSRTVTSGAYSLSRLEGGLEGPIVGPLIDKFGARKLIFVGVILGGIGFIVLSRINNALGLYLVFGLLISMGYNTGFFHATTTAAANWFIKRRSRALGLITVGGGLGGAAIVPLLAVLITHYGWRWAAIIIGLAILAIGIPLAFIIRSKPEDKGMLPDGIQPGEAEAQAIPEAVEAQASGLKAAVDEGEVNFTVREALRTKAFWTYIVAMMLRACILSSIVIHQIPHLTDVGISYTAAANCLGIMVFISIPGRFIFGWLGDMFDKRVLMFITCVIQAVGIFIFVQVSSLWMAYLFVTVYGLGYGGAIPLSVALRGQLFGRKIFATIGGISSGFSAIGTVAAPVLAGYVFDVSGSYSVAFYALMALILLSGFAFLMIRYPKPPARLAGYPA